MTAEKFPVLKLTQEAYDQLRLVSEENPEAYLDPETDFHQVLVSRGITDYAEDTGVFSNRPISLTPVSSGPPNRADTQALGFYHSLTGMTPKIAVSETSHQIWAWMTHFQLHAYCVERWPRRGRVNPVNHIRSHWFVEDYRDGLWDSNAASRNWWIAHTAIKAAQGIWRGFHSSASARPFRQPRRTLPYTYGHWSRFHLASGSSSRDSTHPVE